MTSGKKPDTNRKIYGFEDGAARFEPKVEEAYTSASDDEEFEEVKYGDDLFTTEHDAATDRADRDLAFSVEYARTKTGPVIIPFGLQGSGKSTFLATLFKALAEAGGLKSEVQIPEHNDIARYSGQVMLNEWNELLTKGRFVEATNVGDENIREVEICVTPLRGQRTPLTLSVLEVSGEDLRQVVVEEERSPRLPEAMRVLFAESRAQPMLVLLVHPEKSGNDTMFDNLFLYLRHINTEHPVETMPLLVLIPNPMLALAELQRRKPEFRMNAELTPELCPEYLKIFAPRTYAIFSRWPKKKRGIMPYHVGRIERSTKTGFERIGSYDDEHAKAAFRWIYKQYTGKELGQSWWTKMMRFLDG